MATSPSAFLYRSGLHRESPYIVSGKPWCQSDIDCKPGPVRIKFPKVTRWVEIFNQDEGNTDVLKVAFSEHGLPSLGGTNFFKLEDRSPSVPGSSRIHLELKLTEIWIEGSDNVEVIAGLTSIDVNEIDHDGVINWSGSIGVG
jgi:hypothetical protein